MRISWPMVGRSSEVAVIGEVLGAASTSGGVVLSGPAGVGKTRLARQALQVASAHGYRCRWIVATASAQSVPLGAFSEFATDLGPDPMRNVEAVIAGLTGSAKATPTVIGIDDAHLLDDQSALVIYQLVRRRIAKVVLTRRVGVSAPAAITAVFSDARLTAMEIAPLSSAQVNELLRAALGGTMEMSSARRMWRYTQGNVLYLRQLMVDELAAGRITTQSGVWIWNSEPHFSPTLIDLIESNIGRQNDDVVQVLDLLTVEDPLELAILVKLASQSGVDEAQKRGLIAVDQGSGVARLGHPMFGEVRRSKAGKVKLRSLRGQVADAIGELGIASPLQSIRQAVLLVESDARHEPGLLLSAAGAALQLLDLALASRLAHAAVQHGGGWPAQLTYALTLAAVGRGSACEELLATLAESARDVERPHVALLRAANLAWNLGLPARGAQVIDEVEDLIVGDVMTDSANAIRASCHAALGQPAIAVQMASDALGSDEVTGLPAIFGNWALICGYGDTGRVEELSRAAVRAYALTDSAPEASHVRFGMGLSHVDGLRLAGELTTAATIAEELGVQAGDIDASHSVSSLLRGNSAMARGDLVTAQYWIREALAVGAERDGQSSSVRVIAGLWLSMVLSISGDHAAALTELEAASSSVAADVPLWGTDAALARAWVEAASGIPSRGATIALAAAAQARAAGRAAREVICLQTATQFGDTTCAPRLAELASVVGGPRVGAVLAHARALRAADGAALLAASAAYEAFGDRVAAADAAAQSVATYRAGGFRGSSMTATVTATRLAAECGASTPAIRAVETPVELTVRQREVIALAATGLSNKEIADHLHTSVRTVEGHLFRASQRAGVNTRDELIQLLGRR